MSRPKILVMVPTFDLICGKQSLILEAIRCFSSEIDFCMWSREHGIAAKIAQSFGAQILDKFDAAGHPAAVWQVYHMGTEARTAWPTIPVAQLLYRYQGKALRDWPNLILDSNSCDAWFALSESDLSVASRIAPWIAGKAFVIRQPVDRERFRPTTALNPTPKAAIVYDVDRPLFLQAVEYLKAAVGPEVSAWGYRYTRASQCPEEMLNRADLVVACGRCAVEAMACGRNVVVASLYPSDKIPRGVAGLATAETAPAFEDDNYFGTMTANSLSVESLRDAIAGYDPKHGPALRVHVESEHETRRALARLLEWTLGVA